MSDLHRLSESRGALKANVVFVHGLGGGPFSTWQAAKLDAATLWPRWLAEDIGGIAIWSVGYEAPVSLIVGATMGLWDRAENILGRLITEPKLADGRIILIGHSLGGLVIKQLLEILERDAKNSKAAASLLDRIDKVAFLATPHTGADLAVWAASLRILVRPSEATMSLGRNDENLRRLNDWYRNWSTEMGISHLVLRETMPVPVLGMIVKPDSSDPGLHRVRAWATDHDHSSIAKPPSRDNEVYAHVKEFILDPFERPKPRIEGLAVRIIERQQEIQSDTQELKSGNRAIVALFKQSQQGPDISIVVGSRTFEIRLPNSADTSPASGLELPWQRLESAVQPGDYNLLDTLRWNFGLVEKLYGRDDELKEIVGWAERASAPPSARLVTGDGGAGKTRLAAAVTGALRERGWIAGFLKPGLPLSVDIGNTKGLFIILDYPEENLDLLRALIKMLADTKTAAYPIRLLLLSRRGFDHWQAETLILEGRFGNHPIAAPGDLSLDDTLELIDAAAANFASHAGLPKPGLDRAAVWAAETPLHRLPLIAAAAAIHAVLAPQEAFGIEGAAIVRDLAKRERARVRRTSERLDLGPDALGHLLALGTLGDGLKAEAIEHLAAAGLCGDVTGEQVVKRIANTPWWRSGRLVRLQPDRMAAAFLGAELFDARFPDGDPRLSVWLSIALTAAEEGFGNRLGRILFDMDMLDVAEGHSASLEKQLTQMIEKDPKRALRFESVQSREVPYAAVGFASVIALALARLVEDEPPRRAVFLNNASNHLSRLGRREEALPVAKDAVEIFRDLARARSDAFTPKLAAALNSLGNVLSGLGRREEALAAAREAVGIYRDLARARVDAFTPDLALSLNNLATMLADVGHRKEALAAAREAAKIYLDLERARPDAFTPDLAMSVNNLSTILSQAGLREQALAAAREAVGIFRDLVSARPDAFTPDLAMSVSNLATMLSALGHREEALVAAREAVGIYRDLARARPGAFTPDLAASLIIMANRLSEVGHREEALAAARQAVVIRRDLARARPDAFMPNLGRALNNLANKLSAIGHIEEALVTVKEAVAIQRDLARVPRDAFKADLAVSLNSLANMLSAHGHREEALAVAREVKELNIT